MAAKKHLAIRRTRTNTADSLTKLDEKAVQVTDAPNEQTRDEKLKEVANMLSGTPSVHLANMLQSQVQGVQSHTYRCNPGDQNSTALQSLATMVPQNFTEAMLATQMIETNAAMGEFFLRSVLPDQGTESVDRNVNRVVKLGRLF